MSYRGFNLTVGEVAARAGGIVQGSADELVRGISPFEQAAAGDLVFIGSEKYAAMWASARASVALVSKKLSSRIPPRAGASLVVVDDADLALSKFLSSIAPPPPCAGLPAQSAGKESAIHPSASVDPSARLGTGTKIGAFCIVGPGAVVGDGTVLYPHAAVFDDATIGKNCTLWPGAIVRERCVLGDRCILHANAVIGADGFGVRPAPGGKGVVSIRHIGHVEIGNDVEIGACTCIDRGKFAATVIGDHCKIDNLCQIGHNCRLGRAVVMAGNVGVSGSVTIGDGVLIGGGAGIADHLTIGAGASISAAAGVMRDIAPGARVGGLPAKELRQVFRELSAVERLPGLFRQLRGPAASNAPAVAPPIRKTFHDWLHELNAKSAHKIVIRDFDGLNRSDFDRSYRQTLMTEKEFQQKLARCTFNIEV